MGEGLKSTVQDILHTFIVGKESEGVNLYSLSIYFNP